MKPGDRVEVTYDASDWFGQRGVISHVVKFGPQAGLLVVELDGDGRKLNPIHPDFLRVLSAVDLLAELGE
jgi:hypothetical protein